MPPWPLSLLPSGARATMQAVMGAHAVLTCDMQGRVIDANPALLALPVREARRCMSTTSPSLRSAA